MQNKALFRVPERRNVRDIILWVNWLAYASCNIPFTLDKPNLRSMQYCVYALSVNFRPNKAIQTAEPSIRGKTNDRTPHLLSLIPNVALEGVISSLFILQHGIN